MLGMALLLGLAVNLARLKTALLLGLAVKARSSQVLEMALLFAVKVTS